MSENEEEESPTKKLKFPTVDELLEQTMEQLAAMTHRCEEEERWRGYYESWYKDEKVKTASLQAKLDTLLGDGSTSCSSFCHTCKVVHTITCGKR